jgi:hypothetical protein
MSVLHLYTLNQIHDHLESDYTYEDTLYDISYEFKRATIAFGGVDMNTEGYRPLLLGLDVLLYKYYDEEDGTTTEEDRRCVLLEITKRDNYSSTIKKIYADSRNYWNASKKIKVIPSLQETEIELIIR